MGWPQPLGDEAPCILPIEGVTITANTQTPAPSFNPRRYLAASTFDCVCQTECS